MAATSALRASARAAYRDLLRASASTFAGDKALIKAFRHEMRGKAAHLQPETDPTSYQDNVKLMREIAQFLRRNVVQAVKSQNSHDANEIWKLSLNQNTEMGSNETIKEFTSANFKRPLPEQENCSTTNQNRPQSAIPRYYSSLKKAHKERRLPELKESDLVESFVRGSGPGGQSINKTENNVQLLHKPTGIRVNCQQTRSLQMNRKLARRVLFDKLDDILNPGLSKHELQRAKQRERERRRRKKAKKRAQDRLQ